MAAGTRAAALELRSFAAATAILVGAAAPCMLAARSDAAPAAAPVHGALLARPDSLRRGRIAIPPPAPSASDTILLDNEPEDPRASYGTFEAARESLAVIVRRALGACADSARWTRGRTHFLYWDKLTLLQTTDGHPMWNVEPRDSEAWVPSLTVNLISVSGDCPDYQSISNALSAAGWSDNAYYGADGTDGTVFAHCCREAICRVQAQWDGGDDSDSTYVADPGFSLEVVCVPRPRDSAAYRRARRR